MSASTEAWEPDEAPEPDRTADRSEAPRRAADGEPARPQRLGLALVVIATAQLMVVLDASIVNVALPSIQRALHFSTGNLEWVINAYTLVFGGLLLFGGRTGDLFGRRRMFVVGVSLFSAASLLGGFATSQLWLVAARGIQGVGGAIAAPTALSLVASTFPEGPQRDRAMGVYAAMSGAGAALGVLLGGLLTDYFTWRVVLFVNVPIGLFVALTAPRVLRESAGARGESAGTRGESAGARAGEGGRRRLDLPGALTATGGMTLVVYGLINADTHPWTALSTVGPLGLGIALLIGFVVVERRASQPLLPLRLLRDRNRAGAYSVMLCIGTAVFAIFFFLTLFLQDVLGYSPLRTGIAYLPFALILVAVAGVVSQVVGRTGPRLPIMVGTLVATSGMVVLSFLSPSSTYWSGAFPGMLLVASGIAMCFVPLTLSAVAGVSDREGGIASALLNTGQQVGGSLGLAILGTVSATVFQDRLHSIVPGAAAHRSALGGGNLQALHALPPALQHQVLGAVTDGYDLAFRVAAAIMVAAFVLAATLLRRGRRAAAERRDAGTVPLA